VATSSTTMIQRGVYDEKQRKTEFIF
jgi:hypothetical protein